MRVRTTFFHRPESPVDPAQLRVGATLTGPTIEAAREDRVTVSLDEVPAALARVLGTTQELHVRWAARAAGAEPISPLFSRVSPGLHVSYVPAPGTSEEQQHSLTQASTVSRSTCASPPAGVSCSALYIQLTLQTSFNHVDDQSRTHQFYAAVADLAPFAAFVESEWCPSTAAVGGLCSLRADQLKDASTLDLSYDAYSGKLKISTQWPMAKQPLFVAALDGPNDRTEVGILGPDQPSTLGPHELAMSGFVAVLSQDDYVNAVMFSFSSRHRAAAADTSFSVSLPEPTGLHPTLQMRVSPGLPPRDSDHGGSCRLYTYLTLPRHIFADRYQFGDALFLASKNLTALQHMTQPVDLEAPEYAVGVWGSAALIELAPPVVSGGQPLEFTAAIPLHLRYLLPSTGGYRTVEVPYPVVFWACENDKTVEFTSNPFDRVHIGYDTLFDEATEFWHVRPQPAAGLGMDKDSADLVLPIRVPVLNSSRSQWVNVGTAAVVLLGFSWVLWKLLKVYWHTGYGRPAVTSRAKKTQ